MDLSPQDVGRLLRFAPFAIAVLVALWTRLRSGRRPAKRPTGFPSHANSSDRPANVASPAAAASSKPIEPR